MIIEYDIKQYLLIFALFLMLGNGTLCITSGAAEPDVSLRNEFTSPPSEFRLMPIMHGSAVQGRYLPQRLSDLHAGGAVIDAVANPGQGNGSEPWSDPRYLNESIAFQKLSDTIARMKARDQQVWIYDELGYPSGSAGGRVLEGHPKFAVQAVRCRSMQTSGDSLKIAVQGKNLISCQAFPVHNGVLDLEAAINLTSKAAAGDFEWTAPEGNWTVCLFERFVPDTWKRHNIPRRNVNIMDRKAVARFIDLTHERYARELGPGLQDIELFFTDEPQLGAVEPWMHPSLLKTAPAVQWCDELPVQFANKKGYPVTDALPALFHDVGPATGRMRYDFYDVYSDLIAENYYGQIEDWCHSHRVASSGHMLLEESLLFHLMFSGSMIKNWSRQDLPGVDQLNLNRYKTMGGWNGAGGIRVNEDFSIKMAASIRTLCNKQGVFSESYALSDRAQVADLAQAAKGMAGWQYACGVTHMCTYTLQQKLSAEDYAGVSDYVGRLAVLCRRGTPVSDIAVLVPEASVWAFYNPPEGGTFQRYIECNPEVLKIDDAFRESCHQLLMHQRDFEVVSEQLLSEATVNHGRLDLAGQSFAFLVLPEARMLSHATMQKIEDFAASGGHVIFTGELPSMSTEKGQEVTIRNRAEQLMNKYSGRSRFLEEEGNFNELVNWMTENVLPEIQWDGSSAVRIAHQREPGREIVLIANPSVSEVQGKLQCRFGGRVSVWNPENGAIREVGARKPGEVITLEIPGDSARFVVFEL